MNQYYGPFFSSALQSPFVTECHSYNQRRNIRWIRALNSRSGPDPHEPWMTRLWWTGFCGLPYFTWTSMFLKILSNRPTSMFYKYPFKTVVHVETVENVENEKESSVSTWSTVSAWPVQGQKNCILRFHHILVFGPEELVTFYWIALVGAWLLPPTSDQGR